MPFLIMVLAKNGPLDLFGICGLAERIFLKRAFAKMERLIEHANENKRKGENSGKDGHRQDE